MPLTPADIHNREFGKSSLGRRGYDEEEVDSLLDDVTREMIRLLEENDALRGRLDAAPPPRRPDMSGRAVAEELSAVTAALDRAHRGYEQAEHRARLARRQLDEAYRSVAAAPPVVDEEAPSEMVLGMAQRTADNYLREAHEKSRVLLAEAREQAERAQDEARRLADDIDLKAHRQHDEAAAQLVTRRNDLLQEMEELTRFAADYHAALERHLHRQGQLIDGTAES
ncbi:DivIVA domain-containing protein [Paractinoplanes hotanensis]|uniref:Cell wall synthesis protein Wag31 n=1 Tax=Paractinoplanes hotanensis TaxID=2906497 RepID=A0ABT0XXG8_9ACTN|nr:DivIVA domain-containing protein [Actinoplanes hotanensis]MCM4077897.1 DivIVA domain-containing protein [Actinoplanes hotanensis]